MLMILATLLSNCISFSTQIMMSITGFEQISGMDVLPICSILITLEPKTFKSFSFSILKKDSHSGYIFPVLLS